MTPFAEFERFIVDTFDSEEAMMVLLAARDADGAVTAEQLRQSLIANYGAEGMEDRRLAEKRIELRLRDLATARVIEKTDDGRFRYARTDDHLVALVDRLAVEFTTRRGELNRLIYSPAAVARRVAEAFRL